MTKFFKWYQGSFEDFLKLDSKAARHLLLKYQNEHSDTPANTVNNVMTPMCSFLAFLDKPINLRGKRLASTPDLDSHVFTNGDLTRMFAIGNVKEKAFLSLGASLGWEISAVLEFDRKTLQSLVDRAKAEDKQFIYFRSIRKKTGALRLGVLNPLALEWTEKYLKELPTKKLRKRKERHATKDRPLSDVFDMGEEGANLILKRLAKEAGLVLTGRLHFHKIRGWVMSGLSRAGFNEFQIKFLVGKAIPLRDLTYLQTLQQEIEERYPKAYEQYLNLQPERVVQVVDQDLKAKVAVLERENQELKFRVDHDAQTEKLKDYLEMIHTQGKQIDQYSKDVQEQKKALELQGSAIEELRTLLKGKK
jgi:hypothetical protein